MMMTWMWLVVTSQAGPFQMLQPARTMSEGTTEMGGGMSYAAGEAALDQGQVYINGWGRYGLTDRLEVSGGAYLPWIYDLGIHGNLRLLMVGQPDKDGVHLSAGVGAGTQVRNLSLLTFTAPLSLGFRAGMIDVFASPSISATPLGAAGTLVGWNTEAGVAIDAGGIPVYVATTYGRVLGFGVVGVNVGFGYDLGS